ncbi:glycosyltransferase family 2 protein [Cryobacterium sp. Hh38]|uniref:glycosyltransferase n=1 Tax=Cryobacterium sp. Hh38 TaxID=1259156 RepID=UPI00106AE393|nr:glycosyltransferase family 2 protein [Cryobacterium sp. Hh38]TFD64095.1 glycosyltransferase family 2 protein [Cryobacterium sp. Hh38]
MKVSIVIPTYNEAPNIAELVARISDATTNYDAEIIFVDDSSDDTPQVIVHVGNTARLPVRIIHRSTPIGGLAGAVLAGIAASGGKWCIVMDGDLQHPPEMIPILLAAAASEHADVVVASRNLDGGSSGGLAGISRHIVSNAANLLTRAMFPVRLQNCTDPMTGFFAVRRATIDVSVLQPRGFKILLEILVRNTVTVAEEPFVFGERQAGVSKADFRQGVRFVTQLAALRFGRVSGFATIGAAGAVANLIIMAGLQALGVWYIAAAIISAAVTIVGNFLLQERFVFRDLRGPAASGYIRFARFFAFNGIEATVRTAVLWAVVATAALPEIATQAVLIGIGFILRFVHHSQRGTSMAVWSPRGPHKSLHAKSLGRE